MTVSTTDVHKTEKSLSLKVSAGGGAGFCLWRAKAGGSYEREELHTTVESNSMSATLEISLVNISRPWLDATLFSPHVAWNAGADQDKGTVSSGVVETQNEDHLLPFIPMQMIVARNVRLVADWSKEQRDFVANASGSEVSVGWGPFSLNTSHQHKDSLLDEDTQGRGAGLNFPGIQCLGFVSWVPPLSAPRAGEGRHVKRSVPTVKNPAAIEAVVGNQQLPPGQRKPVLKRAGV